MIELIVVVVVLRPLGQRRIAHGERAKHVVFVDVNVGVDVADAVADFVGIERQPDELGEGADGAIGERVGERFVGVGEQTLFSELFRVGDAGEHEGGEPGFTRLAERNVGVYSIADDERAGHVDVGVLAEQIQHERARLAAINFRLLAARRRDRVHDRARPWIQRSTNLIPRIGIRGDEQRPALYLQRRVRQFRKRKRGIAPNHHRPDVVLRIQPLLHLLPISPRAPHAVVHPRLNINPRLLHLLHHASLTDHVHLFLSRVSDSFSVFPARLRVVPVLDLIEPSLFQVHRRRVRRRVYLIFRHVHTQRREFRRVVRSRLGRVIRREKDPLLLRPQRLYRRFRPRYQRVAVPDDAVAVDDDAVDVFVELSRQPVARGDEDALQVLRVRRHRSNGVGASARRRRASRRVETRATARRARRNARRARERRGTRGRGHRATRNAARARGFWNASTAAGID